MTAPRSNLPDHVQGRLQLDEYRRGSEDQREDSEDSREPSCHGAHRLVQDSLDCLSRIRADELFELADHLAPDSLPPEERAGDRADDDEDRRERKQGVEGQGRALCPRIVGVPVRNRLRDNFAPEPDLDHEIRREFSALREGTSDRGRVQLQTLNSRLLVKISNRYATRSRLRADSSYQIRQRSERTIGSPALQPNAAANSGMFEGAPIARKRPSGWGFVLVCKRSNSGRPFVAHTLAQFRKRRCSGVKPSMSGGRGFPSRLFPKAL